MRIASLTLHIRNVLLVFSRPLPEECFHHVAEFPTGAHDDGMDALEGAVSLIPREISRIISSFCSRESALVRY